MQELGQLSLRVLLKYYPEYELQHDGDPGPETVKKVAEYCSYFVAPYNGFLPDVRFSQFPYGKFQKDRDVLQPETSAQHIGLHEPGGIQIAALSG